MIVLEPGHGMLIVLLNSVEQRGLNVPPDHLLPRANHGPSPCCKAGGTCTS